jgi:hypothetical protein
VAEQEAVFRSGAFCLRGTLALPAGDPPFPCVLMIVGSGRVDRDENQRAFRLNVMNTLAARLAERGIGSLRYDKRGVGASEGDFWTAGFFDNVADAQAAVAYLRGQPLVDPGKVFVLGHSEGAYIAARVAAGDPDGVGDQAGAGDQGLAGAVLLAGGARPGEEELHWQGRRVAETLTGFNAWLIRLLRTDPVKRQADQLEKVKRSRKDHYRAQLVARVNARWFREFLAYDPRADLARIHVPVLAITGEKDVQVDPGNLERMRELIPAPFEAHAVPDLTHLLRREEGPPGIGTYRKQIKRPLDPRIPALIIDWLERHIVRDGC